MKKSRLLVLAAASAALCAAAVGCGGKHEHEYGEWDLTQAPTLTEEGSATRTCTANDGEVVTVTVPALSNKDVWTVSGTTDATHTAAGKTVYTSEYGTVEITIAQGEHDWGEWKITKKPNTVTEKGEMKRECKSEDGEEVATIDLTDASVWKKDEKKSTAADHYKDGADVYVSEKYGLEVSITVSKTAAHDWGEWKITQKPNAVTEKGEVKRECKAKDGGEEIEEIDLTDTEVWTKDADKSTPATHTEDGEDVYVSEKYGLEVSITVSKDAEHKWGNWTIVNEPELDKQGTAKHSCNIKDCPEQDIEEPVPALGTAEVWKKEEISADYNHAAKTVYTSE
ncbi:MAG: hypothetical protein K2J30_00255, partial [Clostridia bacterium]|nr:hypothetical protein [Clostridia bacterium]